MDDTAKSQRISDKQRLDLYRRRIQSLESSLRRVQQQLADPALKRAKALRAMIGSEVSFALIGLPEDLQ